MPTGGNVIHHIGIALKDGVFAVVETASIEENEEEVMLSDLFTSIMKDVEVNQDRVVSARTFYLADMEAFCDP